MMKLLERYLFHWEVLNLQLRKRWLQEKKDIDQEEELVQSPSIDEIFSTCIKLLHAKEPIMFTLKDLTLTSCTQNDGQERAKVISFLVELQETL